MTFAAPSMGNLATLAVDASSTTVPTELYEFLSESLTAKRNIVNTAGIRGSSGEVLERLRNGTQTVNGSLSFAPTPSEMRKWLPRILGGAEGSASGYKTYALAESLPSFVTTINRVAKAFVYTGCKVDKATFKASSGQPMEMTLEIEALVGNAPVSLIDVSGLTIAAEAPFMIFDGTLTLAGTAVQCSDVTLVIDNQLKKDRFVNSQTRTDLPRMGRKVTLSCTVPFTADTYALFDTGVAGVTADLKFAVGGAGEGATGTSLHFVLQNVVFPANGSPAVGGKDEITMQLEGQVYKTAGTDELACNLDTTA